MSAQQVTRRTILESIYTLRRRRSVVTPLQDVTNRGSLPSTGSGSSSSISATKSLIQGQKKLIPKHQDSCHVANPILSSSSKLSSSSSSSRTSSRVVGIPPSGPGSQYGSRSEGAGGLGSSHACHTHYLANNSSLLLPRATAVAPRLHNVLSWSWTSSLRRPSLLSHSNLNAHGIIRQNYVGTKDGSLLSSQQQVIRDEEEENDVVGTDNNKTTSFFHSNCPPKTKESDLIVVLDLDECLVHSQFFNSGTDEIYRQQEHRPQSQALFHDDDDDDVVSSSPHVCESFRMSLPGGDLVHVNKRPNLDEFLRRITRKYETHVFTAAMEVYASPLLDRLDPNGDMFQGRYYRDHCTFDPSLGVYVKDLKKALGQSKGVEGFQEGRVVLVDNNPMSFLANPMNGILVCNFYDDPKDDTLGALADLLDELDGVKDVRPFLNEKFGLQDALSEALSAPIRSSWK